MSGICADKFIFFTWCVNAAEAFRRRCHLYIFAARAYTTLRYKYKKKTKII